MKQYIIPMSNIIGTSLYAAVCMHAFICSMKLLIISQASVTWCVQSYAWFQLGLKSHGRYRIMNFMNLQL